MYKYILFDLDGTITDSSKGITNCVKYALMKQPDGKFLKLTDCLNL